MEEKTKKVVILMRKYVIGIIIGFCLSFAVSAQAEVTNMIGKVVDGVFSVKVNGNELEKQAIVIEGTSYLPVRSLGDALNMDVSFDANVGIGLDSKSPQIQQPAQPQPQPSNTTQSGGAKVTDKLSPSFHQKVRLVLDKDIQKNGDFLFIELDGNQYVSVSVLSGPYTIDWNEPNATLKREGGSDMVIAIQNEYSANSNGFSSQGYSFVKLSLFGLTAAVEGDTLVVTQQP